MKHYGGTVVVVWERLWHVEIPSVPYKEDSWNRVRDGRKAGWSCMIASRHDEFEKKL